MGDTLSVSIDTSKDTQAPTLEEEAAKYPNITADENGAQVGEQEERPEWLPEKFKTVEDMAKAYAELEKKQGSPKKDEEAPKEEEPADDTEDEPDDTNEDREREVSEEEKAAQKAADDAGLDLGKLSDKWFEQGSLDESDYAALEKAGYKRDLVDKFAEGQAAIQKLAEQQVFNVAGNEETYRSMIDWARDNYTPAEIRAYDKAINSDMDTALMAVKGLKARYSAEVGIEPTRSVNGSTGRASSIQPYESVQQMQQDMAKPEYQKDPSFRKKVEQRLALSDIF